MAKPVKLILVTAKHHPLHSTWLKLAEEISSKAGLELEVREEDYLLLTQYGDTDELGMPWLPQLLVVYDDDTIKPLLSQMPLDQNLKPDIDKAIKTALEKLASGTG